MKEDTKIHINISAGSVWKILLTILLFISLFYIRDIVMVVLTSVVIASSIEPLIVWLGKFRIQRVVAVVATYVSLVLMVFGVFFFFIPSFLQETSSFLSVVPTYIDKVNGWWGGDMGATTVDNSKAAVQTLSMNVAETQKVASTLNNSSTKEIIDKINESLSNVSSGFLDTVSTVFGGALSFILIIVLSFYFAVQEDGIADFLRVVTPLKHEKYVIDLWKRSQAKIGRWMQGQLFLAFFIGLFIYLLLLVFGIKNALFLGVIAALFETIPLFGPILASIPAIATAYMGGGANLALIAIAIYLVIHQFENHLLYPLVVKKIVGVPPILVILALIIGWKLAGFLGLVLSVPLTTTLMEYFDDLQKRKRMSEDMVMR
jgi:predicted PurR-regulated permease PerM